MIEAHDVTELNVYNRMNSSYLNSSPDTLVSAKYLAALIGTSAYTAASYTTKFNVYVTSMSSITNEYYLDDMLYTAFYPGN